MALVPAIRQRFGQVGQVLGRRGMIGPVILVDEETTSRLERLGATFARLARRDS